MNKERLEKLKAKADRSVEIAKALDLLSACDPSVSNFEGSYRQWNTGSEYLPKELLKEVLIAGRLAMINRLESELESILKTEVAE
jgi:hypothetical protein